MKHNMVMNGTGVPSNGGAPNGPRRDAPFNRWFRYPAGFAGDLTSPLLAILPREPGTVIDPFLGTATLAPDICARGHRLVGVEANPLIARVAALKLHDWPDPKKLRTAAESAARKAKETAKDASIEHEHDVVRRCFTPGALKTLVALREQIGRSRHHREWLLTALAAALRDVSSSSVGWPYQRPSLTSSAQHGDPLKRFLTRVGWMADDVDPAHGHRITGTAVTGDSRRTTDLPRAMGDEIAQACITSPPYLNNYDYADATRLELYFLGLADSWASMCRFARDAMIVASTQQTSQPRTADLEPELLCSGIGSRIEALLAALREQRRARSRPKEYDRLLIEYLSDMRSVLANLSNVLEEGAPVAVAIADSALYGVHIDTPELLLGMAEELGFDRVSCTMHRERGKRWSKNPQRAHDIQLGEYVVQMSRSAASTVR